MNKKALDGANKDLGQEGKDEPDIALRILVGIIIGVVALVLLILAGWLVLTFIRINTYPYIPAPKNTLRSTSLQELLVNITLDANETAVDYSVYRQVRGGRQ